MQGTAEGVGRLPRSPSTDILEEGACPRPHALFYGPSVISLVKRVLDILPFARGEYPSYLYPHSGWPLHIFLTFYHSNIANH